MSNAASTLYGSSFNPNEWRKIPRYKDYYEISATGLVRTLAGRERKAQKSGAGYLGVVLYRPTKNFNIHSLVAAAFIGPRPPKMVVNHIDFNRKNNRWPNLEYVTPRENVHHSLAAGRMKAPPIYSGERNARATITAADVLAIRQLHQRFHRVRPLAELFGVKRSLVEDIVYGRAWTTI